MSKLFRITGLFVFVSLFVQHQVSAQFSSNFYQTSKWSFSAINIQMASGEVELPKGISTSYYSRARNADAMYGTRGISEWLKPDSLGTSDSFSITFKLNHDDYSKSDWILGVYFEQLVSIIGRYRSEVTFENYIDPEIVIRTNNQYIGLILGWDYVWRKGKRFEFLTGLRNNNLVGTVSEAYEEIFATSEATDSRFRIREREYFAAPSMGTQFGINLGMRIKISRYSSLYVHRNILLSYLRYDGSWAPSVQRQSQIGFEFRLNRDE
jgi:hypothetical protein